MFLTSLSSPERLHLPGGGRSFVIDLVKAVGCLLIVLHHLAFYGPMSDVLMPVWPAVIGWLSAHGRLAVQVFLVCAGFLAAGSLARWLTPGQRLDAAVAGRLVLLRYGRLVMPLLAALSLTVLVSEWVRPVLQHDSVSATPQWGQALAHVLLLQHVWGLEALSAGIWYVAVDLQLYGMALLSMLAVQVVWDAARPQPPREAGRWVAVGLVWLVLTCASLWWWNLRADWDDWGLYFFGSYGLGMLAWAARQADRSGASDADPAQRSWNRRWAGLTQRLAVGLLALLVVGGVAWWLEPRSRMGVAWVVAWFLVCWPERVWPYRARMPLWQRPVAWLAMVSYAVFLVHFGISLGVSAVVTQFWPNQPWPNALGMATSVALSLVAGGVLHRRVERPAPNLGRWGFWVMVFVLSVGFARTF